MTTDSNLAERFEELVFRFENAWNQTPPPRLEEFLPLEEPLRMRVLEESVLIDADRRMQLGEAVSLAEYVARLPELAANTDLSARLQRLIDERYQQNWCVTDGAGRYRVIAFHAKGGLGQVSTAADEQLKRTVAIKEIQPRFAGHPVSRQRFLEEAEITGSLEHPGIVPVYGAGTFADGRPYYVMRFIQGTSLTEAIAAWHAATSLAAKSSVEHALEFRKLLGHFIAVCDAVQYAHDRGILHRDLKPSNIMLGKYGETFVVDWGLAKAVGQVEPIVADTENVIEPVDHRKGEQPQTQPGDKLGTLDYMSPEQATGRLEEIGVTSDVYSLGASLYHLLTGAPPFRQGSEGCPGSGSSEHSPSEALQRQFDLLVQRITKGDFPKPTVVKPDVPRALEAICLKAMSLRPSDRYVSTRELASDIERCLADEAISALQDSWWERVGRWSRRHRAFVAAIVGLLSTMVVGLVVGTILLEHERALTAIQRNRAIDSDRFAQVQLVKAQDSERKALAEADRANKLAEHADQEAQRAAQKSEEVTQVTNFLVNLFRTADPLSLRATGFREVGQELTRITADDLLKRGVQRIEDLQQQPLVQATLLEHLGDIYRDLGDYAASKQLLDRAWEQRRARLESDDPAIAETALSLGRWHQDQGHFHEAKEFYDQALSIRLKHWPEESLPVAEVQFHQAWLISDRDQQQPAAEVFRKVLKTREKLLGPNHADTQTARVFLAMNLLNEGRQMDAVLLMAADLQLTEIARGILEYRAADLLRGQGRYDEARTQLETLMERTTKAIGKHHPVRSLLLGSVAGIAQQQGKYLEARRLTEEALTVLEPLLRNHPRMARPATQYAHGMYFCGHYQIAEQYYRHAYRLGQAGLELKLSVMDHVIHESLVPLMRVLLAQGKYEELPALYEQGVSCAKKFKNEPFRADCVRFHVQRLLAQGRPEDAAIYLGRLSPPTRSFSDWLTLAECLHEVRKDEEATAIESETLRLAELQAEVTTFLHFFVHADLAKVFQRHDQVDKAETQFRKAADAQRLRLPSGHPLAADQAVVLAQFLRQNGKLDEAEHFLVQAERDLQINVGPQESPTTTARLERARVQQRRGNVTAAVDLARSVLADRTQLLGADHPAVAEAQWSLAEFLPPSIETSRTEALALLASAHANTRARFGPGHPRTFEIVERRADMLRATGAFDEAIQLLDTALNEAPSTMPRGTSTSIARLVSVRGAIAADRQDYSVAESLLKSSHHRLQVTFGRLDERTQRSLRRLVLLYEAWNKPDEAAEYRRQLLP